MRQRDRFREDDRKPFWLTHACHDVGWIKRKASGQGNENIAAGVERRLHVGQKRFEISDRLHSAA